MRCWIPLAAVLALSLGSGSCTLCKPFVGAVTAPAMMIGAIGSSGGGGGGCGGDGRALVGILAISAALGATAGLVTGVISDVQVLCGRAHDPTRNWWNPFATNTWDGG